MADYGERGELHCILKYALYPPPAPSCPRPISLFFVFFYFFLAAKPQKFPPPFFAAKRQSKKEKPQRDFVFLRGFVRQN
jgi:hypothetical protein